MVLKRLLLLPLAPNLQTFYKKGANVSSNNCRTHVKYDKLNCFALQCILVSGHDMMDLYNILKYTENQGINVYTHGEMLPAHSYPKLREFKVTLSNNYYFYLKTVKVYFGSGIFSRVGR